MNIDKMSIISSVYMAGFEWYICISFSDCLERKSNIIIILYINLTY